MVADTLAPWYWLRKLGRSLSKMRKDFNYLCHVNVENPGGMIEIVNTYYVDVSAETFSM